MVRYLLGRLLDAVASGVIRIDGFVRPEIVQEPVRAPDMATIAPSLDSLHPAFAEPVIGYMSQTGYELLHVRDHWWTAFCRDRADLSPRGGVVEVEVRLRRVIDSE